MRRSITGLVLILALALVPAVYAQTVPPPPEHVRGDVRDYSPFVDRNIPTRVFWGDTHQDTSNSPDAGLHDAR